MIFDDYRRRRRRHHSRRNTGEYRYDLESSVSSDIDPVKFLYHPHWFDSSHWLHHWMKADFLVLIDSAVYHRRMWLKRRHFPLLPILSKKSIYHTRWWNRSESAPSSVSSWSFFCPYWSSSHMICRWSLLQGKDFICDTLKSFPLDKNWDCSLIRTDSLSMDFSWRIFASFRLWLSDDNLFDGNQYINEHEKSDMTIDWLTSVGRSIFSIHSLKNSVQVGSLELIWFKWSINCFVLSFITFEHGSSIEWNLIWYRRRIRENLSLPLWMSIAIMSTNWCVKRSLSDTTHELIYDDLSLLLHRSTTEWYICWSH